MCGIVGAVADRNVPPILLEGLKRLEYRGYDSSGLAVLDSAGDMKRRRKVGKVAELVSDLGRSPVTGRVGIGRTRAKNSRGSATNSNPQRTQKWWRILWIII